MIGHSILLTALTLFAADYTVQQWRAVEITLISSKIYPDPFQDVDVTATFTGPDNQIITRPAFWDGDLTWKVRFAPPQTGLWTMTTSATDITNSGLQNISETVQCDIYTGSMNVYRHGFLKVSENGRYLVHADGTPFFYLGDTHWILPHERFHTSNVDGVVSQFKYTFDKRVAQGFTVFQSEPIWQAHGDSSAHTGADEDAVADLRDGFTAADLPGFKENLDLKFQYIADSGLVHANAVIDWRNNPSTYPVFTEAYMTKLARYWVARYGAYPVIWTIAQEIDLAGGSGALLNKWFASGLSIYENDAYHHPIMPHMMNDATPSNSSWSAKPYHDGWAPYRRSFNRGDAMLFWNSQPVKPAILYEYSYDQFECDSRKALAAAYTAFQCGLYGYGYGANGIWNDIYSKPGEPADYGTDYMMPEKYFWWYDGANLPTGDKLTHFKKFYTDLAWWKLVPRFTDTTWYTHVSWNEAIIATDDQDIYVVFFPGGYPGSLKNMIDSAEYMAQWFNPRDGSYSTIGKFMPVAGQWKIPSLPTIDDWILLVRKNTGEDTIPPASVTTLASDAITSNSVELTWIAPGDNGDSGAAASYDIRYSTEMITEMDFANAQQAGGEPRPALAGTRQRLVVSGLRSSETYFFALKTNDEFLNLSALSNVVGPVTTAISDNIALNKTYSSSSNYNSNQAAGKAFDESLATNWQSAGGTFAGEWLEVDFGIVMHFNTIVLTEYGNRTLGYRIEFWDGSEWLTAYTGATISSGTEVTFSTVGGSKARIYFTSGREWQPIINEFEIYNRSGTSVAGDNLQKSSIALFPAVPNPSNGRTNITFSLAQTTPAEIAVYDTRGRLIELLWRDSFTAGVHSLAWNMPQQLSNGIYFVELRISDRTLRNKILLMR
jgi:hypothetical protein